VVWLVAGHGSGVEAEALLRCLPGDAEALADVGPRPAIPVGSSDGSEFGQADEDAEIVRCLQGPERVLLPAGWIGQREERRLAGGGGVESLGHASTLLDISADVK
jgi:hypothetical protein